MKKTALFLLALAIAMLAILCACGANKPVGPQEPVDSDPTELKTESGIYVIVATFTNNAVVDGKLLVDENGKVALIKYGSELVPSNVEVFDVGFDISELVGLPTTIEIEDGVVKSALSMFTSVSDKTANFLKADGGYTAGVNTVVLADNLIKDGAKYCLVLDGYGFRSGNIFGDYGIANNGDDVVTVFDIDGDGKFDFSTSKVTYNALEVIASENGKLALNGGFGTVAAQEFFKCGSNVLLNFKKSLSAKAPAVGSYVNATIRVDGSGEANYNGVCITVENVTAAKTISAPLQAIIYNSETDIMSKAGGRVMYWGNVLSANEGEGFTHSGRMLAKSSLGASLKFVLDDLGYVVKAIEIESSDLDFASLPGYSSYETSTGTEACALLDVQGGWHYSRTTYAKAQAEISALKSIGIRKVFIVASNPGYPMFSYFNAGYSTRTGFPASVANFKRLGYSMPDYAFPDICHDLGMECIAVYKVYEGGGITTAPEGARLEEGIAQFQDQFGIKSGYEDFLVKNLNKGIDYRVCRRPDGANDHLDGIVDKITVDFVAGAYAQRGNSQQVRNNLTYYAALNETQIATVVDGIKHTPKRPHGLYGINLWVSDDNYTYTLYDGDFTYQYVRSQKVLCDLNGNYVNGGSPTDCITLEITDINVPQKYCAVTFVSTGILRTNPLAFTHIYSGSREIVCTTTDFVHPSTTTLYDDNREEYIWGREGLEARSSRATSIRVDKEGKITVTPSSSDEDTAEYCYHISRFNLYGFEFNFESYPNEIRGNNSFIAIGRGRIETFAGGYCEGYKEVRDYWVSHVEDLCKAGYDAVLIRLQSHSSIATDYINYGFNEPIVEKYKELYGEAAYNTLMDPSHAVTHEEYLKIMRIRGDYFAMFAEEAAEVCHKYGTEFGVCLRASYEDPTLEHNRNEVCWWTMPKVVLDWKRIVDISDFILIKDYINSPILVSTNAKATREYAKSQGKKVYMDVYDDQAKAFTSAMFTAISKDPNTDGIVLYEMSHVYNYTASPAFKDLMNKVGFKVVNKGEHK